MQFYNKISGIKKTAFNFSGPKFFHDMGPEESRWRLIKLYHVRYKKQEVNYSDFQVQNSCFCEISPILSTNITSCAFVDGFPFAKLVEKKIPLALVRSSGIKTFHLSVQNVLSVYHTNQTIESGLLLAPSSTHQKVFSQWKTQSNLNLLTRKQI